MIKSKSRPILLLWFLTTGVVLYSQERIVLRGNVKDKESRESIIGANVTEYDSDKRIIGGTITDANGNYNLNVTNLNAIVMFSYIGYKAQEVSLNGRTDLNVELVPESFDLEEVTITATSTADPLTGIAERNQTTSRVRIDMGDSKHMGAVSAEEALQGRVTGLDIISASGDPGSGSSIVIRGLGSLGNARPLIVVDGIPQAVAVGSDFDFSSADQEDIGDLVNIAPQDIKSIEVLKDAGSTAQWGSKGADGVLQIETYRGKKGKTRFDYQVKYTWNFQPPPIPMLNGDEYIIVQLEELQNARGIFEVPSEIAFDRDFIDFHNYNKNTDWVDAVSRNGFINEQFFRLSGGGEKTRYYASVNLHDNTGTTLNTSLRRITTRVNLDYNISQKLRFSVNFSYTNSFKEDNYIFTVFNEVTDRYESTNIREMAYRKAPNMSIYEYDALSRPTGEYFTPIYSYQGIGTQYFNPVAVGNLSANDIDENRVMNNFTLNYNIRPWVRFQQMVAIQYINQKRSRFLPYNAVGADWLNGMINQAYENNSSDMEIITRSQLYFTPRISSDHVLSGTILFETDQISNEWSALMGRNGPVTEITDPAGNLPVNYIASGTSETHILGLLASANYVMKDRYILFANIRTDASSRFGTNSRWGTFPSMGVAWRFSSEPWLGRFAFLSDGKLSYSYGLSGKQPRGAYDRHAIFNTVNPGQYIEKPIIMQLQVQLANLKWQTLYSHNLRLDVGLFDNRITFSGEIYDKITRDLLWNNYQIPKSSGYTQLNWYNGGSVENRGWEMAFYVNPLRKGQFNLNFNFNISHNTNTFLEFPENFNTERDQNLGNAQFPRRATLGQPIGSFFGVRYLGVWPSDEDVVALNADGNVLLDHKGDPLPFSYKGTYRFMGGDARYEDINHDGMIDIMDVVRLGDSNPDFIGGFGGNLSWNDFRVSTQWHYRLGFEIVNEIAMSTEGMLGKDNQSTAVLHRWRAQGQEEPGLLPRAYLDHPANNLGSDRYVERGDFLRLVNLTFSYNIPKSLCRRLRISSLDVALTMRRIFTLTGYSGQDPEIPQLVEDPFWFGTDKATTPPPRAYTLNFGLGF
jgi:TonB-linked SusC/RagA family outer membrane protein